MKNGDDLESMRAQLNELAGLRKRNRELEQLDRLHRLILESAGEGIFGLDTNGNYTFVNQAAAALLGYAPEELIGRHSHSCIHSTKPDGSPYPETECRTCRAFRSDEPQHVDDECFCRKDGSWFPVEYRSTPIREFGTVVGAVVAFNDITDRRKIQEALRESEWRLEFATTLAHEAIWDWDLVTNKLTRNTVYARMFGSPSGKDDPAEWWRNRIHPDDRARVEREFTRVFKGEQDDLNVEYRFRLASGDWGVVHDRGKAVRNRHGSVIRLIGMMLNITERKQAETRIRESQANLRTIMDSVYDAIFIHDLDGTILDVNRKMLELYRVDREQALRSRIIEDFSAPDNPLELVPDIWKRAVAGEDQFFEWQARRPVDGTVFPVEVYLRKINLQSRGLILANVRDITLRKMTEDALRRSEANYREIFQSVNDAIFVHDIGTGSVVSVNRKAEEMFGYSLGEFRDFLSESLFSGLPGYTAQDALGKMRAAGRGEPQLFEWISKRKNGELFWVEVNLRRSQLGGKTRLLAVVRDITERKRTEETLKLTQFSVDHASVSAFLMGNDGSFLYVNEQACRTAGYACEELLDMKYSSLDPGYPVASWPRHWDELRKAGSLNFETQHRRKDGTRVDMSMSANYVSFGGREYNWAFGLDISERKRAALQLEESEERFRQLAENTDQVFWFMTVEPEHILYVSPAYERIWGHTAGELYRRPRLWVESAHPDDRRRVESAFEAWMRGELPEYDAEYRIVRPNGAVRWVRDRGTITRSADGRVVRLSGIADDITDRKNEQQELLRAKVLLEEAQQIAGVGNWEWDVHANRLIWSDEIYRMFGVVPGRFRETYQAVMELVHPDDRARVEATLSDAVQQRKTTAENEYRIIRPDGSMRLIHSLVRLQFDRAGVTVMRGTAQDVTDARRAEEALRLTQFALDHAAVSTFFVGTDASILYVNNKGCIALGYACEELRTMKITDLDPYFPASRWPQHWEELRQKGFLHFESAHRKKDGSIMLVDISVNYLYFAGKEYNIAFAVDITDRKRGEESLRQSARLTETILDSMSDAISLIDVHDFTIVRVNKVFGEKYGSGDDRQLIGKHCYEVTHHRTDVCSAPDDICPLIESVKTGGHYAADHVHYGPQGEKVYVEVSTSPVKDEAGNVVQVVHVQRDITERKKAEDALRISEARFRNLFQQSALSMQILDPDGRTIEVNPSFEQMWGIRAEDLKEYNILRDEQLVVKGIMPYIRKAFAGEATEIPSAYYDPHEIDHKATGRWVKAFMYPVKAENDRIHQVVLMHWDVTEMVKAEEALRASEERFRAFFETAAVGAAELDLSGRRFLRVNDRLCEITGYPRDELLNKSVVDLTHPDDRAADAEAFESALSGRIREHRIEKRYVRKDGRIVWVQVSGSIIRDRDGRPVRAGGVIQDITERKSMEDEIRHLAHHDALTGLPNRRLFNDIAGVEIAQAERARRKIALLFMDLDRFKEINDTLGHEAGDQLLQQVATRLRSLLRKSDSIGRIGGDEFNIILADIARTESVTDIARKIVNSFRVPFPIAGHDLHVTTSIGISIYPDDSAQLEGLLRYADMAMYHAKERGRNSFQFYDPSINIRSIERMRLENMLHRSLELGEMVVYYQPLVEIASSRIVCAEALLRWRHPERGLLLPREFIHTAEETGFITEIDDWVLSTVCAQTRVWKDAGVRPVCVTINLSARQFQNPELIVKVRDCLDRTGAEPGCIDIEIPESMAMSDVERSIVLMRMLSGMGVHISIDDFGTGYSSLNYLKRMPIEKLKIDQSFITDITVDRDDRAIIQAVTVMAHSMKMRVIAEGVESRDQLAFLRGIDCDEAQGFLFSGPVPEEEFREMVMKE